MRVMMGSQSRKRRDAIRTTWAKHAASVHPSIVIRFIVSQPPPHKTQGGRTCPQCLLLQDELLTHDDLVMVRGIDTYKNLPSKTVNSMRYMLSLPSYWTHLLKTDDDCYVRVHRVLRALINPSNGLPFMDKLYLGALENPDGFKTIRDKNSKWYISHNEMPDTVAEQIKHTLYMAGWGYVVSRDCAHVVVSKYDHLINNKRLRPAWFPPIMPHEDVMVALLLKGYIKWPMVAATFKTPWGTCTNGTAVKHLDVDAPLLFQGLAIQEESGLWDTKTVQCSTGSFTSGHYDSWYAWRKSLSVARI